MFSKGNYNSRMTEMTNDFENHNQNNGQKKKEKEKMHDNHYFCVE